MYVFITKEPAFRSISTKFAKKWLIETTVQKAPLCEKPCLHRRSRNYACEKIPGSLVQTPTMPNFLCTLVIIHS